MQVDIRHAPSFAVARCTLRATEKVKVEAGAMSAHSSGMSLEAKMEGGVFKGLKRSVLGGESLFVSTYTAPSGGGWVDVAAKLPGDLHVIDLNGSVSWIIERGNWLASAEGVDVDTKWGGFKSLVGGEGGFMAHASGTGQVIVASYGAIDVFRLAPAETVIVDSSHILAFPETVTYTLRRAVEGRSIQSIKSGEGFVFEFTGPGDILTQTRNQTQLVAWLNTELGSRE